MLDSLNYEDYAGCLNTKFTARMEDGSRMEFELIGVVDKSPSEKQEQFVLTFLAPADAPRSQGTWMLHHDELGEGLVFLVPVALDDSGLTCEAVFNRMRSVEQ